MNKRQKKKAKKKILPTRHKITKEIIFIIFPQPGRKEQFYIANWIRGKGFYHNAIRYVP